MTSSQRGLHHRCGGLACVTLGAGPALPFIDRAAPRCQTGLSAATTTRQEEGKRSSELGACCEEKAPAATPSSITVLSGAWAGWPGDARSDGRGRPPSRSCCSWPPALPSQQKMLPEEGGGGGGAMPACSLLFALPNLPVCGPARCDPAEALRGSPPSAHS